MSRDLNSRFRRTVDATAPARATIEREKIRHRRPNDAAFEDDHPNEYGSATNPPYDDQGEQGVERHDESSWDDSTEDEWVFDERSSEGGVVWDDAPHQASARPRPRDGLQFHDNDQGYDDFADDDPSRDFGFAPEVELAARRDVRPKPPKPPAQRRPNRPIPGKRQGHQEWSDDDHQRPVESGPRLVDDDDDFAFSSRAGGRHVPVEAPRGRLTDSPPPLVTRGVAHHEMPGRKRRQPGPTRRQPQAGIRPGRPVSRRGRKSMIMVTVLALLGVGGWFAYQRVGTEQIGPTIDRWVEALALPGSERTADDLSLGSSLPAEQALDRLAGNQVNAPSGSSEGGPLVQTTPVETIEAIDPATIITSGPPIPKFKPSSNGSRSLASPSLLPPESGEPATGTTSERAAPSIFERFWSYLTTS